MKQNIAVLGAGVSGLVAASELRKLGHHVTIFEKSNRPGGLQHSINIEEYEFDVGTFLYNDRHELLKTFPFLFDVFVPVRHKSLSLTPTGRTDNYPFSLKQYYRNYGLLISIISIVNLLISKLKYRNYASLPEYTKYYVGEIIYLKTGLKKYIERLNNLPAEEIDIEFAFQRLAMLRNLGIIATLQGIVKRFSAKLPGRKLKRSKPAQKYVRPREGFGYAYGLIASYLQDSGVDIRLESNVCAVSRLDNKFRLTVDSVEVDFDRVISTIPLPVMLRLIGEKSDMKIETTNLVSLFYTGQFNLNSAVLFNFTMEAQWKRMVVFSRFYSDTKDGQDYLTVEVSTHDTSEENIRRLQAEYEAHAAQYTLFKDVPNLVGSYVTRNAYPVYRLGDPEKLAAERAKLDAFGIEHVGRQGNFDYLSSNQAARRAKVLVNAS